MAILRIYSDIVDSDTATMLRLFGAGDAVTFGGVDEFIASVPATDNEIRLKINCRGGMIDEAWTIYDALRATGKEISAEVIGEASSSATILLCAAKKGNRSAHKNAKFLFHYPFVEGVGAARANDLDNIARELRDEERRLLDLYVERTGCDREEMDALMREDRQVDVETAKRLGFIDTILEPKSAINKQNINKMNIKDAFMALGAALGISNEQVLCMEVETADGGMLRLRKESGEIAVGDEVESPDGEYTLPDGRIVVVAGGVVAEIRVPAIEDVGGDPLEETNEEKNKEVGDLEAEVERLHAEIAKRDERIAELERELAEAKEGAPTDEDKTAIAAVRAVGGVDALRQMCSSWHVDKRDFAGGKQTQPKQAASYKEYYANKHQKN